MIASTHAGPKILKDGRYRKIKKRFQPRHGRGANLRSIAGERSCRLAVLTGETFQTCLNLNVNNIEDG